MNESCIQNCRAFFVQCIYRGRIPISNSNGTWCYSHSPEDFDNYLAKFNADDRRKLLHGLSLPKDRPSTRVKSISEKIPPHQISRLLEKLQQEDPSEYQRLVRDLGCSTNPTSPSS